MLVSCRFFDTHVIRRTLCAMSDFVAHQKVLLVDDETSITANLAPFLERSGFGVTIAVDGEKALQQISLSPPDLVILDVLIPRLDGRQVLRRLRQSGNWIPVILLTGRCSSG